MASVCFYPHAGTQSSESYANFLGVQNKDTIDYLDRTNADPMFILTVIIGITALFMSWITGVMAINGWALRREQS